ncbi:MULTISPECIES: hypothetical protein [unclassified Microbacterium]|uniref:hypothetical protein n=1 Tax=unclassified Microbacterium TaxID=2609290 RepID=UPI003C2C3CAD
MAPARIRAAREFEDAENALSESDDLDGQMRHAEAIADDADSGGYEYETVWDTCTTAALPNPP